MKSANWYQIFIPDVSPLEIIARGTVMYLFIFALFRGVKRQAGTYSITDLLVVVLVADASQNAMTGDYGSVADGALLVATLVFWNFFLDWLGYKFPLMERLVHPPPMPLIQDGKLNRPNLRQQLITMDELMSQLREQGVQSVDEVKVAALEGDGSISIIKFGEGQDRRKLRKNL